jgi:hypothetical protein
MWKRGKKGEARRKKLDQVCQAWYWNQNAPRWKSCGAFSTFEFIPPIGSKRDTETKIAIFGMAERNGRLEIRMVADVTAHTVIPVFFPSRLFLIEGLAHI